MTAFDVSQSLLTQYASTLCTILGLICIILNIYVFVSIVLNYRKSMQTVFYTIVMHCAFVDFIRGLCLIIWAVPYLNIEYSLYERTMLIKVGDMVIVIIDILQANRIAMLVLRASNLVAIGNLLLLTLNEYMLINRSIHYRRLVTTRRIIICIGVMWMISLSLAMSNVLIKRLSMQYTHAPSALLIV